MSEILSSLWTVAAEVTFVCVEAWDSLRTGDIVWVDALEVV